MLTDWKVKDAADFNRLERSLASGASESFSVANALKAEEQKKLLKILWTISIVALMSLIRWASGRKDNVLNWKEEILWLPMAFDGTTERMFAIHERIFTRVSDKDY